jgi:hypothetical protein
MPTDTFTLPGIESAQRVLGFTLDEIAKAVQAEPSTLYRWRQGQTPTAIYMSRLERLEDLVREITNTMREEVIPEWMNRSVPAFEGRTPREMILDGRSETVLGVLLSLNYGLSS